MRALRVKAWIWDVRYRPEWPVGGSGQSDRGDLAPETSECRGKGCAQANLGSGDEGCGSDALYQQHPPVVDCRWEAVAASPFRLAATAQRHRGPIRSQPLAASR